MKVDITVKQLEELANRAIANGTTGALRAFIEIALACISQANDEIIRLTKENESK